ncbi:hypothetical protein GQ44DRAFT_730907 [Phaeosphaeriaceae sp. PMI808]|nr:hypothetical protein GQ44DRAFT_730907 [Phaeosphaeriaceae sp. PMI808]
MLRSRKPARPLPKIIDSPPALTTVDMEITKHQGSTVAIEATRERIQAAKKMPVASLSQMVKEREQENRQLEQELTYQEEKHRAAMYLYEELSSVVATLKETLVSFHRLNTETGPNQEQDLIYSS